MEPHSADDVLQAYARGERKFSYWSLPGADLHGADLRDANFYGSDLSGANLSGTDLTRANLGKADLYNANLSGANLSGAYYQDANLTRANMTGVITNNPTPSDGTNQPAGVTGGGGTPLAPDGVQIGHLVTSVIEVSTSDQTIPPAQGPATATSSDTQPLYCIYCGAPLPTDARFCMRCGKSLPNLPAPAEPARPSTVPHADPPNVSSTVPLANPPAPVSRSQLVKPPALVRAEQYFDQELFDQALNVLQQATMSADASIEMWTLLARTLRELWRDEAAFSAAERAVAIDPRDPLALAAKASALLGLHRFEEALRTAEAALTIDPTCLRARRIRAGVLARTGRTQEAIAQFDAILAGGSLDFDTLASKAGLLSQTGKPQEGVLLARNLLDMRPRSVQAHVLLSVALSFADENGEALIVIDRAMRINASDFRIFVARGATYLAMGERSQARSAYDRAIALNPESRSLVQQRDNLLGGAGSAKSQLGNPETAEKAKRMITWSWIVAGAAFVWAVVMALSPSNTVGEGLSLFIVFLITYDAWSFFWGWAPTWRGWKNITDRIGISFSADPIVFLIVVVIVLFALCFIAATYGVFGGGIYHYLKTRRLARSA